MLPHSGGTHLLFSQFLDRLPAVLNQIFYWCPDKQSLLHFLRKSVISLEERQEQATQTRVEGLDGSSVSWCLKSRLVAVLKDALAKDRTECEGN